MLRLRGDGRNVPFIGGRLFGCSWTSIDTSGAADVANAVYRCRVVDHGSAVNVVNVCHVHVGNRSVVVEMIMVPTAAFKTISKISEAINDATVKSYGRTPIALMPNEGGAAPSPITGRPKKAGLWCEHPCARNPEITIISPCPVARGPQITIIGARRLFVHW